IITVICSIFFFFFFQAEDGIRDFHVTGVQTCALPIFLEHSRTHLASVRAGFFGGHVLGSQQYAGGAKRPLDGIECREAWSNHYLCIRLADGLCKFSNKSRSLAGCLVHLPVPGNVFLSHVSDSP